ncbi:unnamed protein product [Spirodela intermedia]|uniref:Protein kinase domain-containing protein n=1 Tax=Spirodela intermedia TaxID=51605 RepID=A0A7I8J439_SPIIN|nr:unnamed protein product [Spirodela intermedia]CAA6664120.1 unnamed protein product [Spirodela intermedia]
MAVKSSLLSESSMLIREKEILDELAGCPEIVLCRGDEVTVESDGRRLYNLFLEYVAGGPLSELCRGRAMAAHDVRRYARSILRGLRRVHCAGYVHCDVKPENVLVAGAGAAKIADFGLAKRAGEAASGAGAAAGDAAQEPPSDIWSFGCVVAEMATGEPSRRRRAGEDPAALLFRIISGWDRPEIPAELPEEGRDFVCRCFAREPRERWTAEMLLRHPFLQFSTDGDGAASTTPSPRSVFGFPAWVSPASPRPSAGSSTSSPTPIERLRRLSAGSPESEWDASGDSSGHSAGGRWITVRPLQHCNSSSTDRSWISPRFNQRII